MYKASKIVLTFGILIILLSLINVIYSPAITSELLRAEVLASVSGVGLILISFLWEEFKPLNKNKSLVGGKEGLVIIEDINVDIKYELGWGTQLFLTATAACSIVVYWEGNELIKRGIISNNKFVPGPTCNRATQKNKLISLVNTKFYPDKIEFEGLAKNLPAVLIYPLKESGYIVVGGWNERCFTKSDEIWLSGWANRLIELLNKKFS